MNADPTLTPRRPIAQHCPELFNRGPTPAELLTQFARIGDRMSHLLADRFALLAAHDHAPTMRCLPVQETDADALAVTIAPLAGNCLLTAACGTVPLLVSFQAEGVLHLLDCAFGGPGDTHTSPPDAFPFSAELMMHRLESTAASTLTTALGIETVPLTRSIHLGDLPVLAKDGQMAMIQIEAAQRSGMIWIITIATSLAALEALFDRGELGAPVRAHAHSATGELFGDLPLTLNAVLVDTHMAVSALSQLRPGQVLPVSVARSVPLRIGGATVAYGTIGALDDRVALQLTQTF